MNTNRNGVTENAFSKIDQDKYAEGWDRVFGKKEKVKDCECCDCRDECCFCEKIKENK